MKSYKDSSFRDRAGQAARAKQEALEKLRSRPPTDPAIAEGRQAASQGGAEAQAEKLAAKKAEQASRDGEAAKAAEAAAKLASAKPSLTEEERKLAGDARYAARKNRK